MTPVEDPKESKPAVQSSELWVLAAAAVPFIDQVLTYIGQLPPGTLPVPIILTVQGLSGLFLAYKRFYGGDRTPIKGLLFQRPNEY